MRAYGSKRTHGGCKTSRVRPGAKIQVRVVVKNHKRERAAARRTTQLAQEN